jgi:hypothetical protein
MLRSQVKILRFPQHDRLDWPSADVVVVMIATSTPCQDRTVASHFNDDSDNVVRIRDYITSTDDFPKYMLLSCIEAFPLLFDFLTSSLIHAHNK